ncbi:MAG: hypothetical protein V4692_15775 [Bdellovibrionota bacterium]
MAVSGIESFKIKAKLLQKAKLKAGKSIQLKDAFELLAKSAGFKSWRHLKEIFEATEHYCPRGSTARWKIWIKDYEEAKAQLESSMAKSTGKQGSFLLPYRDHFFICDDDYVEFLGVDRNDPDLAKVGPNWVEPADSNAFKRMTKTIKGLR